MRKIRTVIIGCGNISGLNETDVRRIKPATHIGAIKKIFKYDLCGVYDLDKSKSEKFKKIFKVKNFSNIKDLIISTKAELVIIAIPYKNNIEILKKILKLKSNIKYIFCEKPMSDSYANSKKIINLCKKNRVNLFINNRRLDGGIQKLKQIVSQRKLGRLNYIEGRCSSGLYALGVHLIDTIKYVSNHKFNFKFKYHDKFSKKTLKFSKNYSFEDPRVISFSSSKDTHCTIINSVKSKILTFSVNKYF